MQLADRRVLSSLAALAVLATLPLVPLRAQALLAEYKQGAVFGTIGDRVGLADDVNGDGTLDLLVAGAAAQGVFTYSGPDGAPLHYLATGSTAQLNITSPGDVNGDGQPDIVTADGVAAHCWSRADGSELWSVPGSFGGSIGWTMAALGDVNGDGVGDVAIGEPDADPAGIVSAGTIYVLDGATGATIHLIHGTGDHQNVGQRLAGFDFDGSGGLEIAWGDTKFVSGGNQVGRALIVDAATGSPLFVHAGTVPTFNFAISVEDAGDLDGDGQHDLAIASVISSQSVLEVRSTADDHAIWSKTGVAFTFRLESVGDANGDGLPELATGQPGFMGFPGQGNVLDGATGNVLGSAFGSTSGSFLSLCAPGDVTGDGQPDLFFGNAPGGFSAEGSATLCRMPNFALDYNIVNPAGGEQLGSAMDASADFDGDGHRDYVLASSKRVIVFSGTTGAVLLNKLTTGLTGGEIFGGVSAVAVAGDYDHDGTPDIAAGNAFYGTGIGALNGRVMILSGASGAQLYDETGAASTGLGRAFAVTGDLSGDGVNDVWVSLVAKTVNGFTNAGEVQLRSGANFATVLAVYHGIPQANGSFGLSLDAGGDVNGDGVRDLAVGSSEDPPGVTNSPGTTAILNGANGVELYRFQGTANSNTLSSAIIGDADGDDVPDILVSEPQAVLPPDFSSARGRLRLFNGATGAMLWSKYGDTPANQFGRGFCGAGDVNGDGFADVAASATPVTPATSSGTVWMLNGKTAAVLDTIVLPFSTPNGTNAGTLLSAGYHDAGGCTDLLVSMPWLNNNGGARVYASSAGGIHGFVDVGFSKQGLGPIPPSLRMYGDLAANQLVTVKARHAQPLKSCSWFVGLSQGNLPFKGGVLVPGVVPVFFVFPLTTDGGGEFSLTAANPAGVFAGLTLWHQFWFSEPGAPQNLSATNGLKEIFK
jgi:hypothetical protein